MKWLRGILLGWATLLAIAFGIEGPLLRWSEPFFGPRWMATVHLMFDSLTLAASGWVAGRMNRSRAVGTGLVFAATLCFFNFGDGVALRVPWMLHLVWNSLHDSRFLDSLIASAETNLALLGCLIVGARLAREREKPVSIAAPDADQGS
jgi:hypothetical protein